METWLCVLILWESNAKAVLYFSRYFMRCKNILTPSDICLAWQLSSDLKGDVNVQCFLKCFPFIFMKTEKYSFFWEGRKCISPKDDL